MDAHFALCFDDALASVLRSAGVPVFIAGKVRGQPSIDCPSGAAPIGGVPPQRTVRPCNLPQFVVSRAFRPRGAHSTNALGALAARCVGWQAWTDRWAARTAPGPRDLQQPLHGGHFSASVSGSGPGQSSTIQRVSQEPGVRMSLLEIRRKLNTSPETVAIVQPSRLEPWKGHRQHLKALSLLAKAPDWSAGWRRTAAAHRRSLLENVARRRPSLWDRGPRQVPRLGRGTTGKARASWLRRRSSRSGSGTELGWNAICAAARSFGISSTQPRNLTRSAIP